MKNISNCKAVNQYEIYIWRHGSSIMLTTMNKEIESFIATLDIFVIEYILILFKKRRKKKEKFISP